MRVLMIGIKGTGMSHLASYLEKSGIEVIGIDVDTSFFTDRILSSIPILPLSAPLPESVDRVIYSTAYRDRPPLALEMARSIGIRLQSYPEALRELSLSRPTAGVSGTHGKTTTTSISAFLLECEERESGAVYGSYLKGRRSAYHRGDRSLVIEACEYQDHFLLYRLEVLVITNIDFDHPDYFADLEAVRDSFRRRFLSLERDAVAIVHSSLVEIVSAWMRERPDIEVLFYGEGTSLDYETREDGIYFLSERLGTAERGRAILEDHIAGILLASALELAEDKEKLDGERIVENAVHLVPLLSSYPGVAARGEIISEKEGVVYLDEYAHHPREIAVSLESLRARYPEHRLVVLFMPHTASRTEALMEDFASALSAADLLFLQSVYSSARCDEGSRDSSRALIERIWERYGRERYFYVPDREECVRLSAASLKRGDVCITMGAGDNRALIIRIIESRKRV